MEYETPVFQSFSEIVQHYRSFLEGKIEECPTYGGRLDEESAIILSQLLKINAAQIITVNSQPGFNQIVNEVKVKQRAYVDCLMKEETYYKIFDHLVATEFIILKTQYVHSDEILHQIPVTTVGDIVATSIPIGYCTDMQIILKNTSLECQEIIMRNLCRVIIFDPIWGRTTDLFENIVVTGI